MSVLVGAQELNHYVSMDLVVGLGCTECPCDAEGCNQTECVLKT